MVYEINYGPGLASNDYLKIYGSIRLQNNLIQVYIHYIEHIIASSIKSLSDTCIGSPFNMYSDVRYRSVQ